LFTSAADASGVTSAASHISTVAEGRHQTRTHLFVAATLYADCGSSPVNIRNMSHSGALIEGSLLPDVGDRIRLKRGQLEATGWIAWRVERKAGVKLEAAVHVADWMSRPGSADQERVDALLSIVRNNASPLTAAAADPIGRASIETELRQLRLELAELEAALLKDLAVAAAHPEIQTLDVSAQRIDRILKGLRSGG
jgi:hypothetical protein